MKKTELKPYDPADFLDSPEVIGHYLWQAAKDGVPIYLEMVIKDVWRALERERLKNV